MSVGLQQDALHALEYPVGLPGLGFNRDLSERMLAEFHEQTELLIREGLKAEHRLLDLSALLWGSG